MRNFFLEKGRDIIPVEDIETDLSFIEQFRKTNGRPLRVLHIGNIANNAYNNAKIQRSYGIEADVLCYDYYHIMGTPEWEDGDVAGAVDPSLPDWWSTNLRGLKRPDWFVQGPAPLCIKYLVARARGQMILAKMRRLALEHAYWNLLEDKATQTGVSRSSCDRKNSHYIAARMKKSFRLLGSYFSTLDPWNTIRERLIPARMSLRNSVFVPLIIGGTASPPLVRGASVLISFWRWQRKKRNVSAVFDLAAMSDDGTAKTIISNFSLRRIALSAGGIVLQSLWASLVHVWLWPVRLIATRGQVEDKSIGERKAKANELIAGFQLQEKDVSRSIWEEVRWYLAEHALRFGPVLKNYDVVQGYSIDGIIPLSEGFSSFCSYEHGTLREIPFENTWQGLICRLVYKNAPAVFITNSDVVGSIDRLELDKDRICFLPHAFDDLKLDTFRINNPSIVPDRDIVHFFCPSRQDWRDQNPSLTKGSDLMLKAAAAVAADGNKFRITLVAWGVDVEASKRLIEELHLESFVSWVLPMDKRSLWAQYCRSHAVLDQFSLPALGGVGFETLALGRRLITRIDSGQLRSFFGCTPPVLPATNHAEFTNSIRSVILDPDDLAQIGAAGRQWIKDYHSARRIVALQAKAYRTLLDNQHRSALSQEQTSLTR